MTVGIVCKLRPHHFDSDMHVSSYSKREVNTTHA